MGRYLDIADAIPQAEPSPVKQGSRDPENLTKPDIAEDNLNARRLLDAGWKPKVSFGGRVIWERPDTGFYRSEEAAICLLDLTERARQGAWSSEDLENNPMQG